MTARLDYIRVSDALIARSRGYCEFCGLLVLGPVHRHHRRPRGMGGTKRPDVHSLTNLMWLHPACHDRIESHRDDSLRDGYLVRQGDDPATVPVLINGGFVLLTRYGTYVDAA